MFVNLMICPRMDAPNHSQQRTMRISDTLYTAEYDVSATTNARARMASKPHSGEIEDSFDVRHLADTGHRERDNII
jgi:hypothetical protein